MRPVKLPVPLGSRLSMAVMLCGLVSAATAVAQMPDPRQMHGQAIPAGDLPVGGVTVRVVRQTVGNNIAGVAVELHGAGQVRRAVTGADGRAQFNGLPPGTRVHAVASVDGERLESSPFEVPVSGGVRTILVAGLGLGAAASGSTAAASAAPIVDPRRLSFGNNTRLAIEFQDDTIAVFYLLEIVNTTGAPAALASPLEMVLPTEASGASALEGASALVTVSGRRVSIAGPLPPGVTSVPIAYRLESWSAREEIAQAFPLRIDQLAIGVQRLAGMTVESPQAASVREASLGGQAFFIASGGGLEAGSPLRLTLAGLPHRNAWPRNLALALAIAIAAAGAWLASRPSADGAGATRSVLEARRQRELKALADLDASYRAGRIAASDYTPRRDRLLADLERLYSELDGRAPRGGGEGLAA